jgi:hypothetical protein
LVQNCAHVISPPPSPESPPPSPLLPELEPPELEPPLLLVDPLLLPPLLLLVPPSPVGEFVDVVVLLHAARIPRTRRGGAKNQVRMLLAYHKPWAFPTPARAFGFAKQAR